MKNYQECGGCNIIMPFASGLERGEREEGKGRRGERGGEREEGRGVGW